MMCYRGKIHFDIFLKKLLEFKPPFFKLGTIGDKVVETVIGVILSSYDQFYHY